MPHDWNNSDPPTPEHDPARDALFAQLGDRFNVRPLPPADVPGPGEPFRPVLPSERYAEIANFYQRLFQITPTTVITVLIVLANAVVFVAMTLESGELLSPKIQTLIDWGGNTGSLTLTGQWWRLVTSMFVHVGIIHIALNMWVLWGLGHLVERLVGNVGYLLLYFFSGIAGSVASAVWNPHVVSAGASGAVFGVFGALMGFVLLRRDSVPREIFLNLRNSGGMFLAYNLLFGISVPGIDMAAHLGGLGAGAVCGVLMSQPLERVTGFRRAARNLLTAVITAGALAAAGYLWVLPLSNCLSAWDTFFETEEHSLDAYRAISRAFAIREVEKSQFVATVNNDVIAPWQEARERILRLRPLADRVQPKSDLILQYAETRQHAWELQVAAIRDDNNQKMQQYQEYLLETERLLEEINSGS